MTIHRIGLLPQILAWPSLDNPGAEWVPGGYRVLKDCHMLLFFLSACNPLAGDWPERQDFPEYLYEAAEVVEAEVDPEALGVLTWNIKFGGGRIDFWFDGHGDRVHMQASEVDGNMEALASLVREFDPDVLLLQEVDIASKRSAYVDMVQVLLDNTDLNYGAWVPVWEVEFIPEQGLGPMKMGQAVLSKYPLVENVRIGLQEVTDQDALTRYFYLDRCIQRVEVDLGSQSLVVLNNHPDAYSSDGTKKVQIEAILEEGTGIDGLVVVGGDFNAVPPGTLQLEGFADDPEELEGRGIEIVDYKNDGDVLPLDFYEHYAAAVPLEVYQEDSVEGQAAFFTHSIASDVFWTRKLDYLFSSTSWTEGQTVQAPGDGTEDDPMALSDHAPIWAVMEVD